MNPIVPLSVVKSPWTGRPLPPNSSLARERLAIEAAAGNSADSPAEISGAAPAGNVSKDLARILRPQAAYRWLMPQLSAITPAYIEQVLRGALAGAHVQQWELFDLMEDTWPRLTKNLNELKRSVCSMKWELHPWQEEDMPPSDSAKERARLVSNALWRMRPEACADENDFKATLYDVMDAWGKGTGVLETDWEIRNAGQLGDITAPRCTLWVHPCCYAWSPAGRLGLRKEAVEAAQRPPGRGSSYLSSPTQSYSGETLEFPEHKFLIAISKSKSGSALAGAMLRPLAWWWCAANFGSDWLMNLAQIFGLPFRWANYEVGASQATVNAISSMLEDMGSAGWAAFPAGTTLELKEAGQNAGNSPQADLIDRADKNCDLIVLGQTLTSDTGGMGQGSGSLALGKVHGSVRDDVIKAVAGFAAGVINFQLVPSIVQLNYGDDQELPEFRPVPDEEEDEKGNADRDAVLLAAGVEMPKDWFYKRHDIPLPQAGEAVIKKAEPSPTSPTGPTSPTSPTSPTPAENLTAKAAIEKTPSAQTAAAMQLAKAVSADFGPVAQRLATLRDIQDPAILKAKIGEFAAWLARVRPDLLAAPAAAEPIEELIATALANALAAAKKS